MKNFVLVGAMAALLSACGGGGGGDGNASFPGSPVPANKLAAYVGNWTAGCDSHELMDVTITSPSDNTLKITTRSDYYVGANCTGAIVATETESADITATFVDTVDASIVLAPGASATQGKVDKILAGRPASTRSITGTAVTRQVNNGQAQWCIDFGNGSKTCVWDEGTAPAQNGVAGGLHIQGNVMYELMPNGSLYEAYGRYTRK